MKLGFGELIVIFIVALLVIGPDKLPEYARKLGAGLREFRNATSDVTQEIRENVIDPLNEAQQPLREAMEPLEEMQADLQREVKGVEKSLNDVASGRSARKSVKKTSEAAQEAGKPEEQSVPQETAEPEEQGELRESADPEQTTASDEQKESAVPDILVNAETLAAGDAQEMRQETV